MRMESPNETDMRSLVLAAFERLGDATIQSPQR
jgi:hypothetical protein